MQIGYARVSKTEQDTELQRRALEKKAYVRRIYAENSSGVKYPPQFGELLGITTPASKMALHMLGAPAEFECSIKPTLGASATTRLAKSTPRACT